MKGIPGHVQGSWIESPWQMVKDLIALNRPGALPTWVDDKVESVVDQWFSVRYGLTENETKQLTLGGKVFVYVKKHYPDAFKCFKRHTPDY